MDRIAMLSVTNTHSSEILDTMWANICGMPHTRVGAGWEYSRSAPAAMAHCMGRAVGGSTPRGLAHLDCAQNSPECDRLLTFRYQNSDVDVQGLKSREFKTHGHRGGQFTQEDQPRVN